MADREGPTYRGIRTYRDPSGRFEFRYPSDWYRYELSEDRDGIMYSPEPENPQTWFAVWSTLLQDAVVAEDIDVLRQGVDEGLAQLAGVHVESNSEDVFGNMIRFKRIYTFEENGAVRKRTVWMLYAHKWLFALIAQGATAEAYDHWHVMLHDCLGTFNVAPALWFACDRDLAGQLK